MWAKEIIFSEILELRLPVSPELIVRQRQYLKGSSAWKGRSRQISLYSLISHSSGLGLHFLIPILCVRIQESHDPTSHAIEFSTC